MSPKALLGLGSSLGDRNSHLQLAIRLLNSISGLSVIASSRVYTSVPLGCAQSTFYNQCCIVHTSLSPQILLSKTKMIEKKIGRKRSLRWADRIIDIDILLFDQICVQQDDLIIPHPHFSQRAFVLQPANEIAGSWYHPTLHCRVEEITLPLPRCW